MTAALEGGDWLAARFGRTLPPGKTPVHILQEGGWAPGPVGKSRPVTQSLYRLSYPAHTPDSEAVIVFNNLHFHTVIYNLVMILWG